MQIEKSQAFVDFWKILTENNDLFFVEINRADQFTSHSYHLLDTDIVIYFSVFPDLALKEPEGNISIMNGNSLISVEEFWELIPVELKATLMYNLDRIK